MVTTTKIDQLYIEIHRAIELFSQILEESFPGPAAGFDQAQVLANAKTMMRKVGLDYQNVNSVMGET